MNKPVVARVARSVCPHDCPSTCALDVEIVDAHTIGRVRGAKDDPYTAGVICEKVARYAERIHHPGRLTHPLRRVGAKGEGRWQPISWDDAFDEIVARWERIEAEFGAEAIWPYFYAGTMGHVHRDGINRLRTARGYSDQYDTICTGAAWPGYLAGTGLLAGPNPELMAEADCVVIWGTNAVNTQVNVMTHAMRARKERGARIVAVDIYMNGTMEQADMPILLRPGSDGAFALGVMHVLLRDGLADRAYLARMTDFDAEVEAHILSKTPDWASSVTGVPVADIEAFARLVGTTPKTYFRLGYGFTRQRNGSTNMHAALCIPAVTGAWQHRAGGAFHSNSGSWHLDKSLIEGTRMGKAGRELDMSEIGKILTGDRKALKGATPVKALFIQNTNPVNVAPEQELVRAGVARDDLFTVVHEQFMTETAQVADIVLPATMFLEHNDYYRRGGHTRMLIGPKLVEAPGECRSNFEVVNELLRRLGSTDESLGFTDRQMVAETMRRSDYGDLDEIEKTGFIELGMSDERARFADGFNFADGRFRFRPAWAEIAQRKGYLWTIDPAAVPPMVDWWDINEKTSAELPFRLSTSPSRSFLNSTFTETLGSQKRQPMPTVLIRPDDAAANGIADGAKVTLGNHRGTVELTAVLFAGLPPGCLIAEGVHPNRSHEGGKGINTLIGSDQVPPFGGVAFHDATVWIRTAS
ncbi:MAG: molybdopterin-dependent oxidoreductase [Devosia sp.]|uniref:molybdopterin-dependent oxidoreductase n=1 Tax=Devosia sp. 66-22 TaxID=1895753 RepID=UPI00092929B3|nr:molybdopterin-dependent oxidoreductase [Devosia sp. 66-22]MBN9347198.1 molybdopterin-dependent oxidoreductase [Devosia sp.]OJX51603.1 MAG: dehydrogenase [Devosia sp. 66-22]